MDAGGYGITLVAALVIGAIAWKLHWNEQVMDAVIFFNQSGGLGLYPMQAEKNLCLALEKVGLEIIRISRGEEGEDECYRLIKSTGQLQIYCGRFLYGTVEVRDGSVWGLMTSLRRLMVASHAKVREHIVEEASRA